MGINMRKRIISLIVAFSLAFCAIGGRVLFVGISGNYAVSDGYNSYALTIGKLYPTIFDRNKKLLTNNEAEYVAIIRPNEKCLSELSKLFNNQEVREITKELSAGYPILRVVDKYVSTKYIKLTMRVKQNSSTMLCRQFIDKSCGGLEKYYNEVTGELKVNFAVNALGRVLDGDSLQIIDDNYDIDNGVITTIDSDIQQIAENASKNLQMGTVVILDTETSEILASVSKPNDYVNRAVNAYSIGSIFKLVVCASALENELDETFNCGGSIKVGDTTYSCQKGNKHGMQNMRAALANSCNCYFVDLALKLGTQKLHQTSSDFNFGNSIQFCEGFNVKAGNLPSLSTLNSKGQLALLGFGQGGLTTSPVHFAAVIATIANGGIYHDPVLVMNERRTPEKRIISEKTAKTLLSYMHGVVTNGTGKNANYNNQTAGKTATAQTGQYNNGKEILHTYFAGVYPYDNPKYSIIIMNENGTSGAVDCCPIFKIIVQMIDEM